jgi:hypothetical protein
LWAFSAIPHRQETAYVFFQGIKRNREEEEGIVGEETNDDEDTDEENSEEDEVEEDAEVEEERKQEEGREEGKRFQFKN